MLSKCAGFSGLPDLNKQDLVLDAWNRYPEVLQI